MTWHARARAWLSLAAFLALASFSVRAIPCGAFFAGSRESKTVPSLSVEQTLILFDPEQELEHFVREIVIRDPSPGFGFVVPVPERPLIANVKVDPFAKLAAKFPLTSVESAGGMRKGGTGAGMVTAAPVTVLSRQKVGSFTAFVLSASDAKALDKWFSDNRLLVPQEAAAWLAQYVKLGFYFAALRYEAQEKDLKSGTTRAETVRISFKTPAPFYPYREPVHPTSSDLPRELSVWLVSTKEYTPVSLFQPQATSEAVFELEWKRPLREHAAHSVARADLESLLSEELSKLLPGPGGEARAPLRLQIFEDQKRSRAGFGDIVMVPKQVTPLAGPTLERSRKLMASLDPAVTP